MRVRPTRPAGRSFRRGATPVLCVLALTAPSPAASGATPAPTTSGASAVVHRCGTIAVPRTQARATTSLRGRSLACGTVRRVVRSAYGRSVLLADTRPFTVRDAGRSYRCRYAPGSGGIVCETRDRRLRGTIVR